MNLKAVELALTRLEDEPSEHPLQPDFTVGQFCGTWITTNSASRGTVKMIIAPQGEGLLLHTYGAWHPEPKDWGTTVAQLFHTTVDSRNVRAFAAVYDLGFVKTHMQAKTEQGVLVVATFNQFTDGSGRANYFSREFFFRAGDP